MIKKLKNLFSAVAVMFLLPFTISTMAVAHVSAQSCDSSIQGGLNCGTCLSTSDQTPTGCPDGSTASSSVNNIITDVINIFSIIVGVVSVIFVIIGGFKYITSSGDAGNVSSAQKTIIYALVGLVVVALAQIIVKFVLNKATTSAT